MADLLDLVIGSGGTHLNMRVALMNLQIKSFAYQGRSCVRAEVCFGNRENTNQMTALAMVMDRVKRRSS